MKLTDNIVPNELFKLETCIKVRVKLRLCLTIEQQIWMQLSNRFSVKHPSISDISEKFSTLGNLFDVWNRKCSFRTFIYPSEKLARVSYANEKGLSIPDSFLTNPGNEWIVIIVKGISISSNVQIESFVMTWQCRIVPSYRNRTQQSQIYPLNFFKCKYSKQTYLSVIIFYVCLYKIW